MLQLDSSDEQAAAIRRELDARREKITEMERVSVSASKSSIRRFVITEKAPTRAFSWLKAATTAFAFKTLLRHYAKRALTPSRGLLCDYEPSDGPF